MWQTNLSTYDYSSAQEQISRQKLIPYLWMGLMVLLTFGVFAIISQSGIQGPDPLNVFVWFAFVIGAALIAYRPRYGIYLILFLALVSDTYLTPAFPFTKNLSSTESLLYVNDAIIISPLEIYLVLTIASWLLSAIFRRDLSIRRDELFGAAVLFTGFIVLGLVYGLGIRGGNVNIGLWEARPILYLPLMLILAANLLKTQKHFNNTMWAVMLALAIEGVIGTFYYTAVLQGDLTGIEQITEHSAAIHMNTVFLFVIAAFLFRGVSNKKRMLLILVALTVIIPYLATQRRAAFISLGIALLLTFIVLFRERRQLFWVVTPISLLVGLAYLGAFWNSGSVIALPAQAVKSVVSTRVTETEDWYSNFYRILENLNISYTMHSAPLLGVGFGNPFIVRVVMPDISFFEWWQFFTHNSILWIWLKTGIGGFVAMIVLIGTSVMTGVRALWHQPTGNRKAIAMVALFYIIMHFTFAYVDISWDIQSMLLVGTAMGLLSALAPEEIRLKPSAWNKNVWRRWMKRSDT